MRRIGFAVVSRSDFLRPSPCGLGGAVRSLQACASTRQTLHRKWRERLTKNRSRRRTVMGLLLRSLFGCLVFGILSSATASAEECSGTITAEEALRAEDARYTAQIANDFVAME